MPLIGSLVWPFGGGCDQVGGFSNSASVGVDAYGADLCTLHGLGICRRLVGHLAQVLDRPSAQRISRLCPAAALPPGHDPPREFSASGVEPHSVMVADIASRDACTQASQVQLETGR